MFYNASYPVQAGYRPRFGMNGPLQQGQQAQGSAASSSATLVQPQAQQGPQANHNHYGPLLQNQQAVTTVRPLSGIRREARDLVKEAVDPKVEPEHPRNVARFLTRG